ncbi:MAG: RNA methyltransferase [Clostridia bacterium]
MIITSLSNNYIERVKKLLQKKYRQEFNQFLVEGERLLSDAIRFNANISYIVVSEDYSGKIDTSLYNCVTVSRKVFDCICDTINSQGILAVVDKPQDTLCAPKGNCLILDCIQDPGNLGTILRTARATSFSEVYCINCVDEYSPKVLRSAMSAHFTSKIMSGSYEDVFRVVKSVCKVYCADMNGESVFNITPYSPFALALGNEGNGVSKYTKDNCDKIISLPMNNDMESLNVSVSAGILMYLLSNK